MCFICVIDEGVEYENSHVDARNTAFADQLKTQVKNTCRADFDRWLKEHSIGIILSEEQLALYDELFLIGCRATLRVLNSEDLVLMLHERDELRGDV